MSNPLDDSYRYCCELSRRQAKNFYYSFLLLPPGRRRAMCALYAFLRHTDDLADEPGSPPAKRTALEAWRRELDQALNGHTGEWAGLQALADTVRRHHVPATYLHEVLDGVAMDIEPHPFVTFDQLYAYCYRVASAVGLSCLHIWGYNSDGGRAESLAESCGIALQLTNILRDVREDAQSGRIYLPNEDLERFGVAVTDLTAAQPDDRVRKLLAFEAQRAYSYYEQARPLARLVSSQGRPVLGAIVGIYRALLDEIARRDYGVLDGRISLPPWRKIAIALRAIAGRMENG